MAHFARVGKDNIVKEIVVVPDDQEHRGQEYLNEIGLAGSWIQTSITNRIRKVFAQPNYEYLPDLDVFKPNKPEAFASFIFDEVAWAWKPPIPMPVDRDDYFWDEPSGSWVIPSLDPPSWIDGQPPILPPKDKGSYLWNEETTSWDLMPLPEGWSRGADNEAIPPIPYPTNGNIHYWDVETASWVDSGEPIPELPSKPQ